MNAETLERLMLDRALGVLPPDCESLLAAYIEKDPQAAAAGREYAATVATARGALADAVPSKLPAFPAQRLTDAQRQYRTFKLARGVAGIAASLLIGFGIHAFFFSASPNDSSRSDPIMVAQATVRNDEPTDAGGFWSAQRLYKRAEAAPQRPAKRLIWNSPVTVPQPGDET